MLPLSVTYGAGSPEGGALGYLKPLTLGEVAAMPTERSPLRMPAYTPQPQPGSKGRPVSSVEEARAASIDFDGSIFYFPDVANNCIYTKQINMDGSASINVYELRKMPMVMKRIEAVRTMRLASKDSGTQKLAEKPHLFRETVNPETAIVVPRHSSENRRYIPLGFIGKDIIVSDAVLLIPDANIYHFGILTSNVHNAWMRVVCGRIKSDYRYSKDIVYNNFPWPTPTEAQKAKIEQTAQAILDARALYPEASLADLYDEVTMPPELRKAHQANDKAVMQAYGFPVKDFTESDCVAELFKMYNTLK